MLKQLRRRFVTVAMLAVTIVLAIIVGFINITNYSSVLDDIDSTLAMLKNNDGRLQPSSSQKQTPEPKENADTASGTKKPSVPSSSTARETEKPYTTRYFSVRLDEAGEYTSDTENIAAVDHGTAVSMAESVLASGKDKGFLGTYRYSLSQKDTSTRFIFLDCSKELLTVQNYLWSSCIVSLAGMFAVFLLLLAISGQVIRPLTQSYEKQKQFITDAGHELKTPLTIIRADIDILSDDLPENEWLEDICLQTERLSELTNRLIYLSRMDEDKNSLSFIPFPLSDLVSETVQSFQAVASTQGKELMLETQPMLSMTGDENSIRQLLSILLDNALKYALPDRAIQVTLHRKGQHQVLTVTNQADGLKQGGMDYLFERFYRSDLSRNSQTGGYGLGLSIAKSIVAAHRGQIHAHSPDGKALIITVQLPK